MIEKKDIIEKAEKGLEGTELYLVEVDVLPGDRIFVFIDGDNGATIDDCVRLSRFIESGLDRDSWDFELNVSSAGMDRPLKDPRQFRKAIGKPVTLKLKDGRKIEGVLEEDQEKSYVIRPEIRKGKKKKASLSNEVVSIMKETVLEVKRAVRFK